MDLLERAFVQGWVGSLQFSEVDGVFVCQVEKAVLGVDTCLTSALQNKVRKEVSGYVRGCEWV